jgi:hypothetical protein
MQFPKGVSTQKAFRYYMKKMLYGILKFKWKMIQLPWICNGNSPNSNRSRYLCLPCRSAIYRGPHRVSEVGTPTDGLFAALCDVTTALPVTCRSHQSRSTTQRTYRATTTQVTSSSLSLPPLPPLPSRNLFVRPQWTMQLTKEQNYNHHTVSIELLFSDPQFDNCFLNTYTAKQLHKITYSTKYASLT